MEEPPNHSRYLVGIKGANMSAKPSEKTLHLPALAIQGFRGIKNLTIPRLGRVTLLAGENGVGKSSVLDAARLYAAQSNCYPIIRRLLQDRDERTVISDDDDSPVSMPDFEALFFGRQPKSGSSLVISPGEASPGLCIKPGPGLSRQRWSESDLSVEDGEVLLKVSLPDFAGKVEMDFRSGKGRPAFRKLAHRESENAAEIPCHILGPTVPGNATLADFWSSIALTEAETGALQALRLIYGDSVEQAVVVDDPASGGRTGRRMLVRVKGLGDRIPLRSLGEGAVRMYCVALALANSSDGLLLLDEVENGIHYRRQHDFWKMVIQTAQKNDVQVIATTHSWDCIVGFSQATTESEEAEGVLYRIDRNGDHLRAVEYTEKSMQVAARQRIEVR